MRIYRKVIPKIAKDVIRSLLTNRAIEVEEGHRDEAELDVAGVLVEYLNDVDRIKSDAQDALARHNLGTEHLSRIKRSLSETRKIEIGENALDYVVDRMIKSLFNSRHIEEVFAEDVELRRMVIDSVRKYLGVDEELDREVRGRIKHFREGTSEWEIEYGRLIGQMRQSRQA